MRYLFQVVAAIVLIGLGKILAPDELRPEFVGSGLIMMVVLIIVDAGYDVVRNWSRLTLVIKCFFLGLSGTYIRFSMAYQYRIVVNGKYLLVKNSSWDHYQHVGGKYKRLELTQKILNDFDGIDDPKMPTVGLKKHDLAVFIPAKNAIRFIDWFNTGRDREISHAREFYEELVEGKGRVLDPKIFPYVNYNFRKSVITPIKRAEKWNCWEILQYDVLDLIPTPAQEKALEELQNHGESEYIKWADPALIQSLGYDERQRKTIYNIGAHTKWVLNLKWSSE
jgi:hypothetical protein